MGTSFRGNEFWDRVGGQALRLANSCLENHQPIITSACPPERSQKALRPKLVPILPRGGEFCFPAEVPRTTQPSL